MDAFRTMSARIELKCIHKPFAFEKVSLNFFCFKTMHINVLVSNVALAKICLKMHQKDMNPQQKATKIKNSIQHLHKHLHTHTYILYFISEKMFQFVFIVLFNHLEPQIHLKHLTYEFFSFFYLSIYVEQV